MPVPSPRNKILPARGNFADLSANVASLLDGEICYAIDQDQYYQNEGGTLVSVGATKAQGAMADSAVQPGDNISTLTNDSAFVDAAGASAAAPVQSVAGKTGDVTLVKADITDFSDADYATAAQGTLADGAVQRAGDTMTGALGIPVGSDSSPSIYFDANTGLYSPGADQVAISTGGTGRMRIDSAGRVGIGTSTPDALLTVNGNATISGTLGTATVDTQLGNVLDINDFAITTTVTDGDIDIDADGAGLLKVTEYNLAAMEVVTKHDIGTNANEVPLNGFLGAMAYKDDLAIANGILVADLPTAPTARVGNINRVTDGAAALAWGATVTGGGSTPYLVWFNGTSWTVFGA